MRDQPVSLMRMPVALAGEHPLEHPVELAAHPRGDVRGHQVAPGLGEAVGVRIPEAVVLARLDPPLAEQSADQRIAPPP